MECEKKLIGGFVLDFGFFENRIYHNSRMARFRCPQGALHSGTSCSLGLYVHKSLGDVYCTAHILNRGENTVIPMFVHSRDSDKEMRLFTAKVSPFMEIGLAHYYFSVETGVGTVYYGCTSGTTGGEGRFYTEYPTPWQITVYDKTFKTPDWFKNSIMYQIFPDRFNMASPDKVQAGMDYHKKLGRHVIEKEWQDEPMFQPEQDMAYYEPCDYFGGDIEGIIQKIPYIKSLGANVIYLNPVFESDSNHRYNTADYKKIDPILGDGQAFKRLCSEAERQNMRIILDGVFSHTGSDSVYFNRNGNYPNIGAFQSRESPYFPWYDFKDFPKVYRMWWGFPTLPEVVESNEEWQDYVIKDEESVLKYWIQQGASGWRLDVADELPDDIIELMREHLKQTDDAVLLGEVWEDATNKEAFGIRRTYALGRGLDSVMNYPFRNAVIDYLMFRTDGKGAQNSFLSLAENYPQEMYFSLMNLLGSHDVQRLRTVLGGAPGRDDLTREQQAVYEMDEQRKDISRKRQFCAALIQYMMPGVPALYYGDEAGMFGMADPFNRKTFPWGYEDKVMQEWYSSLGKLRSGDKILQTGWMNLFAPNEDVLSIMRAADGKDTFDNEAGNKIYVAIINRNAEKEKKFVFDLRREYEGPYAFLLDTSSELANMELLLGNAEVLLKNEILTGKIAPLACCIVCMDIIKNRFEEPDSLTNVE